MSAEVVYSQNSIRALADSRNETRLKALAEVTSKTVAFFNDYPPEEATRHVIASLHVLDENLAKSAQPQYRRAAMLSAKATVAGVPARQQHPELVKAFFDVTLKCFSDQEVTVRQAAIEAANEMVRKFQHQSLSSSCFLPLFRSMLSALTDKDKRIQGLAREMSNSVREHVTGAASAAFSPELFVTFVQEAMGPLIGSAAAAVSNAVAASSSAGSADDVTSAIVLWLLQWIGHVYDLPGHDFVLLLPRFLGSLFLLIAKCSSPEADIILNRSLLETKRAFAAGLDVDIIELLAIAVDCVTIENAATKKLSLNWIVELMSLGKYKMLTRAHAILEVVLPQMSNKDVTIRVVADGANRVLLDLLILNEEELHDKLIPPPMLTLARSTGSESVATGVFDDGTAGDGCPPTANSGVAVAATSAQLQTAIPETAISYNALVQVVVSHLRLSAKEQTRFAALDWILVIHRVRPDVIRDNFETVFDGIMGTLTDQNESVLHRSLETLHQVAGEERFTYFIDKLLYHFEVKAATLLPKAPAIIKQLQLRYQNSIHEAHQQAVEHDGDTGVAENEQQQLKGTRSSSEQLLLTCNTPGFQTCEKLFLKIAELLPLRHDKRFVVKLVIVLNTMLLTSRELLPLREVLRLGVGYPRAKAAFLGLYRCWCYDPSAAIGLCLQTTAYQHAFRLVKYLGSSEPSPQTLTQVDRLVQLLESPVFSFLRVALLQPTKHAPLVKCLFGLQMVLPQSSAQYKALSARLKCVPSVAQLELAAKEANELDIGDLDDEEDLHRQLREKEAVSKDEWISLEKHCRAVQRSVYEYEMSARQ